VTLRFFTGLELAGHACFSCALFLSVLLVLICSSRLHVGLASLFAFKWVFSSSAVCRFVLRALLLNVAFVRVVFSHFRLLLLVATCVLL